MTRAYVDFGSNIKFMLVRGDELVEFVTFDYDESLSTLYSLMCNADVANVTFCMPSYFSQTLYAESSALSHEQLASSTGFFCVSLGDMRKLLHLTQKLDIKDVYFTEHRFFCHEDGVYVFEHDSIYQVYTICGGKLVDYSVQIDDLLNATLQRNCTKFNVHKIVNLVSDSNFELLCGTFQNVFSISDKDTLEDLTYMAYLMNATAFHYEAYRDCNYTNIPLFSGDDDNSDTVMHVNTNPEQLKSADSNPVSTSKTSQDNFADSNDDFDVEDKKSPKSEKGKQKKNKKGSWLPVAAALVLSIAANGALYVITQQHSSNLDKMYTTYKETIQQVQMMQSKISLVSSQSTVEAGSSTFAFLQDSGILKKKSKVKFKKLVIEGSVVNVTVSAKNDDDFWEFYYKIVENYEISGVLDGDSSESEKLYIINMIM